ncbi:uncharacterized protein LOC114755271 [Neltuma alba]|uniref:uncharacterized protein LOC114755271 n=1 Tax=Neltuma alba TaxID=207710 RepID=UPI0010A37036|nr:uncharacterized protein LOC114755271 [Prosopis alba]
MSEDESIALRTAEKRSSIMGIDNSDSDVSSTADELSYVEDAHDLSDSSASNNSEEQTETDQLIHWPYKVVEQQNYESALSFSRSSGANSSMQNSCQFEKSHSASNKICDNKDTVDSYWSVGHILKSSFDEDEIDVQKVAGKHMGLLRDATLYNFSTIAVNDALSGEALGKNPYDNDTHSLNYGFQPQNIDHQNSSMNPLSMNPMLTRNSLLCLMGRNGEKYIADRQPLPCFNFSTVEDPCKVYMDKLLLSSRFSSGSAISVDCHASAKVNKIDHYCEEGNLGEDGLIGTTRNCGSASLAMKDHNQDILTDVHGGSSWERLLGSFRKPINCGATQKISFSTFEMPLDIIIDKCLLQEIILQYKYVSRLTIYFLEEAFELKEHLLALRRYHFMEVADWADLFILSLWHHRRSVTEANERLPEIQGLLESSIQKSSCENDSNKDRLFVYVKGHGKMPFSISTIGVRSFDFLGLGYRVDWPVNIILTPAALKIYADIFSFLIQVKLGVFSLTNVWCSLKDLVHMTSKKLNSELYQHEVGHLNMLIKLRHQVSHFVSTLQQYVESQLSHVSWCRFLHSLHHKVNDMMDLESVHTEYIADALHICFLSEETRTVGSIIESILQCALDFRLCLTAGTWEEGIGQENLFGRFKINISQVLSIKQKFDKNLKELHRCYIKAPKHGGFGLSRFWEYLSYNEYYSDVSNEMGYFAF